PPSAPNSLMSRSVSSRSAHSLSSTLRNGVKCRRNFVFVSSCLVMTAPCWSRTSKRNFRAHPVQPKSSQTTQWRSAEQVFCFEEGSHGEPPSPLTSTSNHHRLEPSKPVGITREALPLASPVQISVSA